MANLLTYQMASDSFGRGPDGRPVVSVSRLRRAVYARALACVRAGHRSVFFRPVDLARWVERQRVVASS